MEPMDLLSVTAEQFGQAATPEGQRIMFEATRTDGLTNIDAIRIRMLEFIHIMTLNMHGVYAGTLNRRFNRLVKNFGVTIPALLAEHIGPDLVLLGKGTKLIYASAAGIAQIEAIRAAKQAADETYKPLMSVADKLVMQAE
jgi:hypothetical protein